MGRTMKIVAVFGVVVFLLALAYAPSSAATTHDVAIKNFSFQPGNLSISVGDTVTWTNSDPTLHTTTSDTGAWNSGDLMLGQSFSFTFKTAGTYAYICARHPSFMHGTITVSEGTLPTSTAQAPTNTAVPTTSPTQAPTSTPVQQQYIIDLPLMIN